MNRARIQSYSPKANVAVLYNSAMEMVVSEKSTMPTSTCQAQRVGCRQGCSNERPMMHSLEFKMATLDQLE